MNNIQLEEYVSLYLDVAISEYMKIINLLYVDAFEENPEAFLLREKNLVDAYLIPLTSPVFPREYCLLLYPGHGQIFIDDQIVHDYMHEYRNFSTDKDFFETLISEKYSINNSVIFFDDSPIANLITSKEKNYFKLERFEDNIRIFMKSLVDKHGKAFIEHIEKPSSYYAKDAYKYIYSDLDFTEVINAVKDPDFEYSINESLAAYDNSLYLAATVTAGVSLENMLVKLIKNHGHRIDDSQHTELGYLTNRLLKEQIIEGKEKQRLMTAAAFRNMASHANPGRTIREDAKLIYQTIFTFATRHFLI